MSRSQMTTEGQRAGIKRQGRCVSDGIAEALSDTFLQFLVFGIVSSSAAEFKKEQ